MAERPEKTEKQAEHPTPKIRTAHDASDDNRLAHDPANQDAKLDVALDETFPTSDPPSNTQPGKGKDPAPSSGYDEAAEKARAAAKKK
ncbi:MAG TPA: hypothetical protein VNZ43_11645 [Sphingomonadaceae bacterium]|jgi:hypothetical protein|nr:hypothetical protein [Sphingomonadaceae bacterium]